MVWKIRKRERRAGKGQRRAWSGLSGSRRLLDAASLLLQRLDRAGRRAEPLSLEPPLSVLLDEHVESVSLLGDCAAVVEVLLLQRHADDADDDEQNNGRSEPKIHGVLRRHGRLACVCGGNRLPKDRRAACHYAETYHTRPLAEGLLGLDEPNLAGVVRQTQLLAETQIVPVG